MPDTVLGARGRAENDTDSQSLQSKGWGRERENEVINIIADESDKETK